MQLAEQHRIALGEWLISLLHPIEGRKGGIKIFFVIIFLCYNDE